MNNESQYTPVRFSHLTSYSGVGAIVRGSEDRLMAVVDTRYWTDQAERCTATSIPYVNRITQALGLGQELRMPPTAQEVARRGTKKITGSSLPAVLFPTYASCKKCGLLHPNPWHHQGKPLVEKVYCQQGCRGLLTQVVWCCVSNKGYLDDVPWHAICHEGADGKCEADYQASYLKFIISANGKRLVQCTKCGYSHQYEKQQLGFISKQQPWIYAPPELDALPQVEIVEINSASVYLPERVNALVIPPESRISQSTVVDKLYNNSTALRALNNIDNPLRKKGKLKTLATQYRCTVDDIKDAIQQINNGYPHFGQFSSSDNLKEEEYKAFLTQLEDIKDDEDFVTEHQTQQWKALSVDEEEGNLTALIKLVDNQIVVKRLREILVFKGFKRGTQAEESGQPLVPPDIIGKSDWLPAIELFGEGVFFTLDDALLSDWEQIPAVKKRVEELLNRYEKSGLHLGEDITITPRFVLLHTLAHLMMRELENSAGYPAASLSERIYHSREDNMAGVLIYVAVADVVGSLGGIVDNAQSSEFLRLLSNAFKHAQWCPLDPVCTEHQGQGPGWLNRAACHGCVLVPETACEYGNVLLDRVFIKGSRALGIPNFLTFVAAYQ